MGRAAVFFILVGATIPIFIGWFFWLAQIFDAANLAREENRNELERYRG